MVFGRVGCLAAAAASLGFCYGATVARLSTTHCMEEIKEQQEQKKKKLSYYFVNAQIKLWSKKSKWKNTNPM